jgi:hypothetical protein
MRAMFAWKPLASSGHLGGRAIEVNFKIGGGFIMAETFQSRVSVTKTGTTAATVVLDADAGKVTTGGHALAGAVTFLPPDGFAFFHIDNGPAGGRPIGRLRISHGSSPGSVELMSVEQNGNVGIGNSDPAVKLHVHGNRIRLESGGRQLDLRADGSALDVQANTHNLYVHSRGPAGRNHVVINPFGDEGNVGIGTAAPSDKLHVVGNVRANDFLITSDVRLKTAIRPLRDAAKKLAALRGVEFTWRDRADAAGHPVQRRGAGVIAQEVEAVAPELVEGAEYKSVNLSGMIGMLVEAFKDLTAENRELKSRIEALECRGTAASPSPVG